MFEKIKAFFEKKPVIITEAVVMGICSAGLFIGGISGDAQAQVPSLVGGILLAIETIITFFQGWIKK